MCKKLEAIYNDNHVPSILLTDNGTEFRSNKMKALHLKFKVEMRNGSPYKPSTQGAIESWNKTLKRLITKYLTDMGLNRQTVSFGTLQEVTTRANAALDHKMHYTTKQFPGECFYGRSDNAYHTPPGIGRLTILCFMWHNLHLCVWQFRSQMKFSVRISSSHYIQHVQMLWLE